MPSRLKRANSLSTQTPTLSLISSTSSLSKNQSSVSSTNSLSTNQSLVSSPNFLSTNQSLVSSTTSLVTNQSLVSSPNSLSTNQSLVSSTNSLWTNHSLESSTNSLLTNNSVESSTVSESTKHSVDYSSSEGHDYYDENVIVQDQTTSAPTLETLFKNRLQIWPLVLTIIVFLLTIVGVIVCCISKQKDLNIENQQKKELKQIRAKHGQNKGKFKLRDTDLKTINELEKKESEEENRDTNDMSVRSDAI